MDLSSVTGLKPRVALLIDGDNFPRAGLSQAETKVARMGEVTIRRVFGDMTLHKDWAQDTAVIAMHCTTAAGKNRADMALVIAAMDLFHRGLASTFVILSDDRDFDPLVSHLREQGCRAERIGRTPRPDAPRTPTRHVPATRPDALLPRVRAMVAGAGAAGFPIQSLGVALHQQGIIIADTPQKSLRAWLTFFSDDFDCDPRGPGARVRLRP